MQLAPEVDVTDRVPGFLGVTSGYAEDAGEDLLAVAFGAAPETALYVGLTSCDVYELRRALDAVIERWRAEEEARDLEEEDLALAEVWALEDALDDQP